MKYSVWLDDNKFTYAIANHRVAEVWSEFISQTPVSTLRSSLDPWHGVTNIPEKIVELNKVIEHLNDWLPNKLDKYLDELTPEARLNQLHTHFPEQERIQTDPIRQEQLRRYNDLIHQIDLGLKSKGSRIFLLICPDVELYKDIELEDYSLFQPRWSFGDLMLHYPHVGRHPFEIFTTNDFDCPSDQIVCQNRISTSHTLRFFEANVNKEKFKNFYKDSKILWPYEYNDPRLSFGYIKLGQLVSVNDKLLHRSMILNLVKNSSRITNWEIH